jgi:hypothetical protein
VAAQDGHAGGGGVLAGGGIVGLVGLDKPACSLIVNSKFFYIFVFQYANLYDRLEIYRK